MFTGIIEEVGNIAKIEFLDGGIRFFIEASNVLEDLKAGSSISVNGVCLTATGFPQNMFTAEAVAETLEKSNLGELGIGDRVNLERPIMGNGRFGGHFVQGHVNARGKITQWRPRGENWFLEVKVPAFLMPYIIPEGSIAIDGISLTVAQLKNQFVGINIIPHTVKETNLQFKSVGSSVNIEVDMIAKYVENLLAYKGENR